MRRLQILGLVILGVAVLVLAGAAYLKSVNAAQDAGATASAWLEEHASPTPTPQPTLEPTPEPTPEPTTAPPPTGPRAVIVGDEHSRSPGWPDVLAEDYGWDVVNLSEAGMGFLTVPDTCDVAPCTNFRGQLDRVVAADPEIVILVGGGADGDYALDEYALPTMTELMDALPAARLVVLSPISSQSPWPYYLLMHVATVQEIAEAVGATYLDTLGIVGVGESYADGQLTPAAQESIAALLAAELVP